MPSLHHPGFAWSPARRLESKTGLMLVRELEQRLGPKEPLFYSFSPPPILIPFFISLLFLALIAQALAPLVDIMSCKNGTEPLPCDPRQ